MIGRLQAWIRTRPEPRWPPGRQPNLPASSFGAAGRCPLRPLLQRLQQRLAIAAVPGQQQPRIAIELLGEDIEHGGNMFAGFGVVGAAATHLQVGPAAREEGRTGFGEGRLQVGGTSPASIWAAQPRRLANSSSRLRHWALLAASLRTLTR